MASITEWRLKIKAGIAHLAGEWGLIILVFLLAFASFGLGRLSALRDSQPPISVTIAPTEAEPRAMAAGGLVVASRSGSAYYYPWCGGASNISPANTVWFNSEAAAQKAGYVPAKNCKGLAQ